MIAHDIEFAILPDCDISELENFNALYHHGLNIRSRITTTGKTSKYKGEIGIVHDVCPQKFKIYYEAHGSTNLGKESFRVIDHMRPPYPAPRLFSSKSQYQKLGAYKEPVKNHSVKNDPDSIHSRLPKSEMNYPDLVPSVATAAASPQPDVVASATRVSSSPIKKEHLAPTYNKITQCDDIQQLLKSLKNRLALNQISIHDDEFFEYLQLELIDLSL